MDYQEENQPPESKTILKIKRLASLILIQYCIHFKSYNELDVDVEYNIMNLTHYQAKVVKLLCFLNRYYILEKNAYRCVLLAICSLRTSILARCSGGNIEI